MTKYREILRANSTPTATPTPSLNNRGWVQIGDNWFCYDVTGNKVTVWLLSGGKWNYLRSSGAMATGWIMTDNDWYYLDAFLLSRLFDVLKCCFSANSVKTACRFRQNGMLFRFTRHGVTLYNQIIPFCAYLCRYIQAYKPSPSSCSGRHPRRCCP